MKNYLIIGAATGIGARLTAQLAVEGCRVFATWHNQPAFDAGPQVSWHRLDVLDEQSDFSFLPDVLHGMAYCPGSISLKPFARIPEAAFVQDFRMQVGGAVRCIQAALPALKKAEQASVVLFSTVAVQTGFNFHSLVSASKGAVEGLTRALAAELAPGIRVNAIAPSITDTPLAAPLLSTEEKRSANAQRHPLRRIGRSEDIAQMAGFLLSEQSGWMTGQILHVDGGISSLKV